MTTKTVSVPSIETGPTLEAEDAALVAAAAVTPEVELSGEPAADPERPAWLPEKFKTAEDMAKAYAELEKGKAGEVSTEEASDVADAAIEAAGLDMDALSAEFADKGELSEASLAALAKQGITPEMVNSYVTGQTAQSDAARANLLEPVGGEEAYLEMVTWAGDNMDDASIKSFNDVLAGGDPSAVRMAVENLHTKYTTANGAEPSRQLSGKTPANSASTYGSTADLMKDMQNPEYAKNPAFRAKVEAKLERSSIM